VVNCPSPLPSRFLPGPPPRAPLFPSTTLFRSLHLQTVDGQVIRLKGKGLLQGVFHILHPLVRQSKDQIQGEVVKPGGSGLFHARSEEHTSELQSRENLVCRLLLEKKTQ